MKNTSKIKQKIAQFARKTASLNHKITPNDRKIALSNRKIEHKKRKIASLLRRATSRVPSQRQVSALLSVLDKSAARAKAQTPWFRDQGNHCEVWWVWPNEHLEGDEYWERYGDAEGMMRGWSTALHSVMTSYGYLHD